ncbi:hypothetical protein M406DRAFT_68572 [Cryphonectria parasitica EP155]|uniref:Uncharacterized protein n=1 Tax=Cryphonectria parasitica (strain ATCC 38755 / EP155) TaxID=660469 RepID=A0A9P4Y4A8_CRYP1|nr:uncharacterized protein M406DRAFT_68572 [Cryphonectria parasitica EP155]KAF3766210.1 hypothetical protein M406DRAFT_68572 [Cryphonectria parasitica EP155]
MYLIPPQADKPVQALLKAAADLVASPGARRGPLLAAYEATTGPALRAIGVVPGPRGVEKSEPASKKPSTIRSKPTSTRSSAHINTPHHDTTTKRSFPSAGPTDRSHVAQSQQQGASTTMSSAQPPHHRQEDAGGDHHLEKLERQALRRRKVEALESLAHTAALFLAEFMTYTKREVSRPSATAEPAGGGQENSVSSGGSQGRGTDHAASAAAMAANMFKPLTATRWSARASAENPLNGAESYGGESDSDSDSSVDDVLGINRPARDHDGNDTEVEGPGHSNVNDDDDEEEDATAAATAATTAAVTGRHQEDESEERNLQQRNVKSEDQ